MSLNYTLEFLKNKSAVSGELGLRQFKTYLVAHVNSIYETPCFQVIKA